MRFENKGAEMSQRIFYFMQGYGGEIAPTKNRPLWSITKSIRTKQKQADNALHAKIIAKRKSLKNAQNR